VFNARVCVGYGVLPTLDAVKLSHDVFLLAVYKRCFVSFDCRVRLKTEMEKAVFQFTISLNIGMDRVAETLPPSRWNAEGGSNKQFELPRQHPGS